MWNLIQQTKGVDFTSTKLYNIKSDDAYSC